MLSENRQVGVCRVRIKAPSYTKIVTEMPTGIQENNKNKNNKKNPAFSGSRKGET